MRQIKDRDRATGTGTSSDGGLLPLVRDARSTGPAKKTTRIQLAPRQVVCRLADGEAQRTAVVRASLDPVFNACLRFRLPTVPAGESGDVPGPGPPPGLTVEVMHADLTALLLPPLCAGCELRRADPGAVLLRGGSGPDQVIILERGAVGIFEDEAPAQQPASPSLGVAAAAAAPLRAALGSPAQGQAAAKAMVEVGRVARRGACFGEVAMMAGVFEPLSAVALTPVVAVCLPAHAFGELLVRRRRRRRCRACFFLALRRHRESRVTRAARAGGSERCRRSASGWPTSCTSRGRPPGPGPEATC